MKAKKLYNEYFVNYLSYNDIEKLMSSFLDLTKFDKSDIQTAKRQKSIIVYGERVEVFFKIKEIRRRITIYDLQVESSVFNKEALNKANFELRKYLLKKTTQLNEDIGKKYRIKLLQKIGEEVEKELDEKEKSLIDELNLI